MRNVTLSIQDELLKAGREYAQRHHISLNDLIRQLLTRTVTRPSRTGWLEEAFKLADKANIGSRGIKWRREDAYDV
ncbi:MAG: hypothetical protein HYS07_00270 [Chlamydiae bacterium]|nr:hypothetical protein [Chlamydiota bacterium]MBI3276342.1 hypothetical protein [Chlamydiota bacterium]